MYTPAQIATTLPVLIATNSERYGVGSDLRLLGSNVPASTAWSTVNRALYMPLYLDRPGIVTKFWTYNGATAAGNIDIGLYDSTYKRLSSKGSTAQAGTSVIQEYDVTDFGVVAGVYFLGVVASLTTTTFFAIATNVSGKLAAMGITQEGLGATTLVATATPAQLGSGQTSFPVAGIAFRTLVA